MSDEVRVVGYVDGFNLYHGMHSRFGRQWLWLDVEALVRELRPPSQELVLVRYFTARVRDDPAGAARQKRYLNALESHCVSLEIHEGRFQAKRRRCHFCEDTWRTYEEKETDVSLATRLVEDAAANRFDKAVIVSADGDLVPAVKAVRRVSPPTRIVVGFPPGRSSDRLGATADSLLKIKTRMLRRSQLPAEIITPSGARLTKPAYWESDSDGEET